MATIVRAKQTCYASPSQWDAWDSEGKYWYLRYRWDVGRAEQQPSPDIDTWVNDPRELYFCTDGDGYGGFISLEEFCKLAGLELRLEKT